MSSQSYLNKRRKKRKIEQYDTTNIEHLPFPEDDIDLYEGVEWICSHILPEKVLWSSNPEKLKPNIKISESLNDNNVVNTWFVQSPVLSSENINGEINWESVYEKAAYTILKARAILIVAGAGLGVDSGLPDYRGPDGFWKAYPKLKDKGLSLESMSHPDWFESDPKAAWGFYAHRGLLYKNAIPHQGFNILKDFIEKKDEDYFVFTSNIDGQFQKAGFLNKKVYEAHGSIQYMQCVSDDCDYVWEIKDFPKFDDNLIAIVEDEDDLPHCPECDSLGRPNVSMFGDTNYSWKTSRSKNQKRIFLKWLREKLGNLSVENTSNESKLVIIEIGCGISLHSLRLEVELLAQRNDVDVIRINPQDFSVSNEKHMGIGKGSLEALVNIQEKMKQISGNKESNNNN